MNSNVSSAEYRILVVDDTVAIHDDFRKILQGPTSPSPALLEAQAKLFGKSKPLVSALRFTVDCVSQGEEGLRRVQQARATGQPYAVAFVDMRMPPGWDGIETTRHLWGADPYLQVVICTAHSDHTWEDTAAQLGTTDSLLILKKPFDNIEVLQVAHALSVKWTMTRRNQEKLADLDDRVRRRTLELQEAEGRFARVFNANPVPTTLQSLADGRYLDVNPAFVRLVGFTHEQIVNRTPAELGLWSEAGTWDEIVASVKANAPLRSKEARIRAQDQQMRDVLVWVEQVEISDQPHVLTTLEDITERILLEQKFQQAQKMEAVGQLAAGIAHDFNNLLTVIQSYTALVRDDPVIGLENRESLTHVGSAAARAAALTRQLLIFSRRQISHLQPVDIVSTFGRMREMLGRLIPEHIQLNWDCSADLPLIMADEANLEQVIINLVVNARDAMPDGGAIGLRVAPVAITSAAAARHPDGYAGQFLQLSIEDTGVGMGPEVIAHLFEPFFTTKGQGKGTGLGLSTVYAIVRQHTGWIEVASTPGKGTKFEIFLPALAGTAPPAKKTSGEALEAADLNGRGERVLLVEDEPTVRLAASAIIARAGYSVTEAIDGPNAMEVWSRSPQPFDLLMTDMVMPNGQNGIELATQLRVQRPRLKVIISTGYSQDLLRQNGQVVAGARLLLKPFTTASLLRTIRDLLDAPA